MKRIGKPEPKPFIVKRDGTLVDRASETVVGRVHLDRLRGWVASNSAHEFIGHGGRDHAARRAWEDWRSSGKGGEAS